MNKKQREHIEKLKKISRDFVRNRNGGQLERDIAEYNAKNVKQDDGNYCATRRRMDEKNADLALQRELREVWE